MSDTEDGKETSDDINKETKNVITSTNVGKEIIDYTDQNLFMIVSIILVIIILGALLVINLFKNAVLAFTVLGLILYLANYFGLAVTTQVELGSPLWTHNLVNALPGTIAGLAGFMIAIAIIYFLPKMTYIVQIILKYVLVILLTLIGLYSFGYKAAIMDGIGGTVEAINWFSSNVDTAVDEISKVEETAESTTPTV